MTTAGNVDTSSEMAQPAPEHCKEQDGCRIVTDGGWAELIADGDGMSVYGREGHVCNFTVQQIRWLCGAFK